MADDLAEIDEGLAHARASLLSFEAQGQLACAQAVRRKIDTLLDMRLMVTAMLQAA